MTKYIVCLPVCQQRFRTVPKRKTTEIFLKEAKEVHGDTYDYSLVVHYKNNITSVEIICKEHGVFKQQPITHLRGSGCRKCYNDSLKIPRFSFYDFVKRARDVHGDRYQYKNFKSMKEKVEIICPEHGSFFQRPQNHIRTGHGCPICANKKKLSSSKKFIKKAKEVHGSRYYYFLVEYRKGSEPVKIICQEHGVFEQIASNHLQGGGCFNCHLENKRKSSEKRFKRLSKKIHGDFYDYSESNYIRPINKIKILCPEHGVFWQTPNNHVSGQRCPKCAKQASESKAETIISSLLTERGLYFEREVIFDGLINPKTNRQLRYDFFLPEKNILIEYDGKQHFKDIGYFDDNLEELQYRDQLKTQYAKQHGIKLIRIPYWLNIEEVLEEHLHE